MADRIRSPLSPRQDGLCDDSMVKAKGAARMDSTIRSWKGPVQFMEELPCRFCGSTQLAPLKKGLDGAARRKLASLAVGQISGLGLPQHNIKLRVTDKGLAGIHAKKSKGLFFESAAAIQYLLAGRKNAKRGTPATYVLLFASAEDDAGAPCSVVHLIRFVDRSHVNDLYKHVHRMMQDSMFSQLFDIHSEAQQETFDPAKVLGHANEAQDSIHQLLTAPMEQAQAKIDALLAARGAVASPQSPGRLSLVLSPVSPTSGFGGENEAEA